MSSNRPELVARQYNKYISQQSPSPTRQTAVKFLMTSKENPFGPPVGPDSDEEQDARPNRFNSARRNNFGGATAEEFVAASPESGVKATMYNQLQQEIKDEARRTSQITPSTTSFQALLGYRSVSPTKNYDYAENAKSQLMHIGSQSPQLSRPIKKVNPYDCFRSGEARQSIVNCVAQVRREVDIQNQQAQASPQQLKRHSSPQGAYDSPDHVKAQPIQPYKKYRPAEDGPLTHAVPNQDPDPLESPPKVPQSSVTKRRTKYTQLQQSPQVPAETNFSFDKKSRSKTFQEVSPSKQTTLGAQLLEKHRQQAQQGITQSSVAWPSRQKEQPQAVDEYSSRSSQLIDFYSQKYNLLDLSQATQQQPPVYQSLAQTQLITRPALVRQHTTSYQVDELRHVNRDVIRSFGLGSLENLSRKIDNGNLSLDQMLRLQATTSHLVPAQPPLGKTMTVQQMATATKYHGAALQIQRHLRGYLGRKEAAKDVQTFRFFKRVQRVALVNQLVHAMKSSYIQIKNTKQKYLKKYIFFSAARIQSVFKGFLARKYKVPIRQKLKGKYRQIEGVALGWRLRRIMKTRDVQHRVNQIRDYEKALEETIKEARQVKSAQEREKLLKLVTQVRQSRATSIQKLIQIVNRMQVKGQWLTLQAAEETDAELRTPRSSRQSEQVRQSQQRLTQKTPKYINREAQAAYSAQKSQFLSAIPSMARQNSIKVETEVPSLTVQAAPQPVPSKPPSFKAASPTRPQQSLLGKSLLSEERKSYDRKYTISHNNRVQPNFNSSSYQEEARASFKKRMEYKPSQAAKASKVQTDPDNFVSAYSQDQMNHSVDYGQLQRSMERRSAKLASARHAIVTRSVELTSARRQGQTRTSRERGWKEPPVAQSQYVLDGEVLTFSRYQDDKHVTREVEQRRPSKSKSHSREPSTQEQRQSVAQKQFSASFLSMIQETKPKTSTVAMSNTDTQQAASRALFSEIDTKIVRNSFAQVTKKPQEEADAHDEVVFQPATAPTSGIKIFSRPSSDTKQSLFGSIEPKTAAAQDYTETFEKSTKTIKHSVIRNNPELEPRTQETSVRDFDFDFSTSPSKQVEKQSISEPPMMTAKPRAPQTTVDKLASLALEGKFSSTSSAANPIQAHVQKTANLVTSSANELLDMLQRRQVQTAVTPEKPAKKPSIFASAVANKKLQASSASIEFGLTTTGRNDSTQKAPSTATFGMTETASVASMPQQTGIKPYEKTRRSRNARTANKTATPAFDKSINMFSPSQPLAYTPGTAQLTPKKAATASTAASPKRPTIKAAAKTPLKRRPSQNPAGLFRKSVTKTAKK